MHDEPRRWRAALYRRDVRSGQEAVVVNLDLPEVETAPQPVRWVDDLHN